MTFIDTKHMCKAVDARRERTKRVNDYTDNAGISREIGEFGGYITGGKMYDSEGNYQGEYSKNLAKRERFEFRMKIYLGIVIGLGVVILLSN